MTQPTTTMKTTRLIRSILPLAVACAIRSGSTLHAADPDPQEAAIHKTAEAFVEAFHKGDAKAVAAFWTQDGDYVDDTGRVLKGRKAIEDSFTELFAGSKGLKLRIDVANLKFPTLDLAIEDGTTDSAAGSESGDRAGKSANKRRTFMAFILPSFGRPGK